MENVKLKGWSRIEDGMMGKFELENGTPVNVCVDNYDDLSNKEQENYNIDIMGVGQSLEIFESEEEYLKSGTSMAVESIIPTGTFPLPGREEGFEESPEILFTGRVTEIDFDPEAKENMPNVQMRISTFGMEFVVYWWTEEQIEVGYIVHGGAWLYGNVEA